MLCAHCGKGATVGCEEHGVQLQLCTACAARHLALPGLDEFLQGFILPRRQGVPCPHCGATAESIEATGLVGCPLCYEALQEPIARVFGV